MIIHRWCIFLNVCIKVRHIKWFPFLHALAQAAGKIRRISSIQTQNLHTWLFRSLQNYVWIASSCQVLPFISLRIVHRWNCVFGWTWLFLSQSISKQVDQPFLTIIKHQFEKRTTTIIKSNQSVSIVKSHDVTGYSNSLIFTGAMHCRHLSPWSVPRLRWGVRSFAFADNVEEMLFKVKGAESHGIPIQILTESWSLAFSERSGSFSSVPPMVLSLSPWDSLDAPALCMGAGEGLDVAKLAGGIYSRAKRRQDTFLEGMGDRSIQNCLRGLILANKYAAKHREEEDHENIPWFYRLGFAPQLRRNNDRCQQFTGLIFEFFVLQPMNLVTGWFHSLVHLVISWFPGNWCINYYPLIWFTAYKFS